MSVRMGERSQGKLEVLNSAKKLCEYTIQACSNEKVFPKKMRWVLANRIVNECLDAFSEIKTANAIKLDSANAFERWSHQQNAYQHLEVTLALIDLSFSSFPIEPNKIEYWTHLTVDAEIKLKSWMKSDSERLGQRL